MIRVFIHGRPQGQDTWSAVPTPSDKYYLNPFLDSRIGEDINAVMQVDIWQENSYYSYIHRKNVLEKGNRPNAYFALTVCFERQYCTQVATLYDLLESVYTQLCLNTLIEKVGEQERFLVAQLKEQESVLRQISSVIQQNVDKYIAGTLIPISNKGSDTTKSAIKTYSTVDVDSPQFITDCNTNKILISPDYSSKDKLPIELKQQISAIELQRQKVENERNSWQSKAEHQQEANEALLVKQKQLQEQIQTLQQQVSMIHDELDKKYKSQINELQNSKNKLNNELSQERQQKKTLQEKNDRLQREINKQGISGRGEGMLKHPDELEKEVRRMASRFRIYTTITMVTTLFNTALLIIIVVLYCCVDPKSNNSDNSRTNITGGTGVQNVEETHIETPQIPIEDLPDYSKARIDIQNLSGKSLVVGQKYVLSIKNVASKQNYQWMVEGEDIVLDNNTLIVNKAGAITIKCIDSHNYIVKQRNVTVE